jgi:hypothetical protein
METVLSSDITKVATVSQTQFKQTFHTDALCALQMVDDEKIIQIEGMCKLYRTNVTRELVQAEMDRIDSLTLPFSLNLFVES